MLNLAQRAAATEITVTRFREKPFNWRGSATCIHLARMQMRMLGHSPPAIPRFRSALSARKALREQGFNSIAELMDSLLPRIAPANMWIGDLAVLAGGAGLDAVVIGAGDKLLGYHDDYLDRGLLPMELNQDQTVIGAWRL